MTSDVNSKSTLTAALLAGGESRRMGADKATIVVDGEPLWSRQLRTLRELEPQTVLISARAKPSWAPAGAEIVLDAPPSRGPLSGLVRALESVRTTHVLVLAIDLPQMTSSHLAKLWTFARPGRGIVPQNGGRFEPLGAVYPAESLAAMRMALADGESSLQSLVRWLVNANRLAVYEPTPAESQFYRNVNTPHDLVTTS